MGHVSNFFPVFFVGVSTKPSTSQWDPSSMEITFVEIPLTARVTKPKNRVQITEFPARLSQHKHILRETQGK